jgi:hypothetical protein
MRKRTVTVQVGNLQGTEHQEFEVSFKESETFHNIVDYLRLQEYTKGWSEYQLEAVAAHQHVTENLLAVGRGESDTTLTRVTLSGC